MNKTKFKFKILSRNAPNTQNPINGSQNIFKDTTLECFTLSESYDYTQKCLSLANGSLKTPTGSAVFNIRKECITFWYYGYYFLKFKQITFHNTIGIFHRC